MEFIVLAIYSDRPVIVGFADDRISYLALMQTAVSAGAKSVLLYRRDVNGKYNECFTK